MKLLSADQTQKWDLYTIKNEPVSLVNLMERAASLCAEKIESLLKSKREIKLFCGTGNNGGDGLVIARKLAEKKIKIEVFILEYSNKKSSDFLINEKRLKQQKKVTIFYLNEKSVLPIIGKDDILIDAIFGTGLSKAISGLASKIVKHINKFSNFIVAIDVPSGLPSEISNIKDIQKKIIIEADLTLTFQVPKLSFFYSECFKYVGNFEVLDINLHPNYLKNISTKSFFITNNLVKKLQKPRLKFSHKGSFGHALLVGGSKGKLGAIILSTKAALRTGCGLTTAYIPNIGYTILQKSLPESMVIVDDEINSINKFPTTKNFSAIGVGMGMGTNIATKKSFAKWLQKIKLPIIIDADALNISSQLLLENKNFKFPKNAILTPHPKEFDRLTGKSKNSFERLKKQKEFSQKHEVIVVLKGAHTSIAMPDGSIYFNSSGNELLATAGSGDVLSGIITSFLAQGYNPNEAAIMGVYTHGLCADAHKKQGNTTMIASDIIEMIPKISNFK